VEEKKDNKGGWRGQSPEVIMGNTHFRLFSAIVAKHIIELDKKVTLFRLAKY
jgi:hypothetical protein